MTRRKLYLTIFIAVSVFSVVSAFGIGFFADTSTRAKDKLAYDIKSLERKKEELSAKKEELTEKLANQETELSTKETVNNYYMEYQKTYDELTAEISNLTKKSEELDSEIKTKEEELKKSGTIKDTVRGKTYSLVKNETYTCPDKIPAGRYIVSGHGTVVIYSSSGKTRAAENLDVAYNNSYTFNFKEKEKIKVSENASLVELK